MKPGIPPQSAPGGKYYTSLVSGDNAKVIAARPIKFIVIKSPPMKAFGKNIFPGIHIDPIQRDLFLVLTTGFLLAAAIVSVALFVFH
jgi:hypothetical protein